MSKEAQQQNVMNYINCHKHNLQGGKHIEEFLESSSVKEKYKIGKLQKLNWRHLTCISLRVQLYSTMTFKLQDVYIFCVFSRVMLYKHIYM